MAKHPKRPRDVNQLGKLIVDIATGNAPKDEPADENPRGRAGGLKGGRARAAKLTPEERSGIAKKAARERWEP